jgi:hypothetical protein
MLDTWAGQQQTQRLPATFQVISTDVDNRQRHVILRDRNWETGSSLVDIYRAWQVGDQNEEIAPAISTRELYELQDPWLSILTSWSSEVEIAYTSLAINSRLYIPPTINIGDQASATTAEVKLELPITVTANWTIGVEPAHGIPGPTLATPAWVELGTDVEEELLVDMPPLARRRVIMRARYVGPAQPSAILDPLDNDQAG